MRNDKKITSPTKTMRKSRIEIIQTIYKFELLNFPISASEAFEEFDFLNAKQIKYIEKLSENYSFLKEMICKFLNTDWNWTRISPVLKSILLNASAELFFLPPKIAINEAVEITKILYGIDPKTTEATKFVNAILQNLYKSIVALEISNMGLK